MPWRLRRAEPGDAPLLALVAAATFLEAFAGIIAGSDIVRHVTANSSAASFDHYLTSGNGLATLAEHAEGGAPIGYTMLLPPALPVETGPGDVELRRIYTLSTARGTGLGHALMAQAIADARDQGYRRMLLGVLGTNDRARRFYEREGFSLAGTRRFQVGDTVFDDVIYARTL